MGGLKFLVTMKFKWPAAFARWEPLLQGFYSSQGGTSPTKLNKQHRKSKKNKENGLWEPLFRGKPFEYNYFNTKEAIPFQITTTKETTKRTVEIRIESQYGKRTVENRIESQYGEWRRRGMHNKADRTGK